MWLWVAVGSVGQEMGRMEWVVGVGLGVALGSMGQKKGRHHPLVGGVGFS